MINSRSIDVWEIKGKIHIKCLRKMSFHHEQLPVFFALIPQISWNSSGAIKNIFFLLQKIFPLFWWWWRRVVSGTPLQILPYSRCSIGLKSGDCEGYKLVIPVIFILSKLFSDPICICVVSLLFIQVSSLICHLFLQETWIWVRLSQWKRLKISLKPAFFTLFSLFEPLTCGTAKPSQCPATW